MVGDTEGIIDPGFAVADCEPIPKIIEAAVAIVRKPSVKKFALARFEIMVWMSAA